MYDACQNRCLTTHLNNAESSGSIVISSKLTSHWYLPSPLPSLPSHPSHSPLTPLSLPSHSPLTPLSLPSHSPLTPLSLPSHSPHHLTLSPSSPFLISQLRILKEYWVSREAAYPSYKRSMTSSNAKSGRRARGRILLRRASHNLRMSNKEKEEQEMKRSRMQRRMKSWLMRCR